MNRSLVAETPVFTALVGGFIVESKLGDTALSRTVAIEFSCLVFALP
jgi:hypothetical protein